MQVNFKQTGHLAKIIVNKHTIIKKAISDCSDFEEFSYIIYVLQWIESKRPKYKWTAISDMLKC